MSNLIHYPSEVIFIRVLNLQDETQLFIEDYGYTTKIMDFEKSSKLLFKLNKFYNSNTKQDIDNYSKSYEEWKNKCRDKEWIDQFGYEYPNTGTENEPARKIEGYIYFLKAENGPVKIGKTISLQDRFNQIQPKLPFKTKTIHILKTSDYTNTELKFHKLFDDKHVNGEWFDLSNQDIFDIRNKNLPQNILDLIIEE